MSNSSRSHGSKSLKRVARSAVVRNAHVDHDFGRQQMPVVLVYSLFWGWWPVQKSAPDDLGRVHPVTLQAHFRQYVPVSPLVRGAPHVGGEVDFLWSVFAGHMQSLQFPEQVQDFATTTSHSVAAVPMAVDVSYQGGTNRLEAQRILRPSLSSLAGRAWPDISFLKRNFGARNSAKYGARKFALCRQNTHRMNELVRAKRLRCTKFPQRRRTRRAMSVQRTLSSQVSSESEV